MANSKIAIADLAEVRRWSFETPPIMGVSLRSPSGLTYPRRKRSKDAIIDTGFEYEVLVPNDIFDALELEKWEYPVQRIFSMADGRPFRCWEAISDIMITGTDLIIPKVPVVTPVEDDGQTDILLGADFLKRLQLLLLGNQDTPEIVLVQQR